MIEIKSDEYDLMNEQSDLGLLSKTSGSIDGYMLSDALHEYITSIEGSDVELFKFNICEIFK